MYIEAIIIGFVIGFIRNGRFGNFSEMRFKGAYLIVGAFVVFVLPYVLAMLDVTVGIPQLFPFIAGVIALVACIINYEKSGMKLIIVGGILNLLIMGLNNYMMPVDLVKMSSHGLAALSEAVDSGSVINYTAVANSHFLSGFLGKIIVLPSAYPFSKLISVGDIIMSLGIVLLVQSEMQLFGPKKRGSMITFQYNPRSRI